MARRDKKLAGEEPFHGSCLRAKSGRLGTEASWEFAQAISAKFCKWHQFAGDKEHVVEKVEIAITHNIFKLGVKGRERSDAI